MLLLFELKVLLFYIIVKHLKPGTICLVVI